MEASFGVVRMFDDEQVGARLIGADDVGQGFELKPQLGRLGYLDTQRGRNGGVRLGRPPREIGIGQVFRAIEGCVPSDACMADADCTCVFLGACALRHILSDATDAFYGHLDQFTLADVLSESAQLTGLLHRVRIPA